jgi:3-hydroxyisobutyrate dehydrogenase-like beta-hydroxyacid dehydrogenase
MAEKTVSVIGMGLMGSALAKAFLANNHPVTVWNRTASKCTPLEQAGAKVAKSVVDAAEASQVMVISLLNYEVTQSLLQTPEVIEKLKGKVIVQLSTGFPREARESEAWANQNGISYLDGAILEYPTGIGKEESVFFYSGSEKVFEENKALLRCLAGNPRFVGKDAGHAATLDISTISVYYGASLGFLHGAAICNSEGFPVDKYLSATIPLLSGLIPDTLNMSEKMINEGSYTAKIATLDVHVAGLKHLLEFIKENRLDTAFMECVLGYCKKAVDMGYTQDELAAVFEVMKMKVDKKIE